MRIIYILLFTCITHLSLGQIPLDSTNLQRYNSKDTAFVVFPKPISWVSDFGHVFTHEEVQSLNKKLKDYEKKTSRQVVVVTVDSITPFASVHEYATQLGNAWGVGNAISNNGLLVVICLPCRQVGIATGLGTALTISDNTCSEIIQQTMIPAFKEGQYYQGVINGLNQLMDKWK